LPRRADAPILDAYRAHTQAVLQGLMKGLGDGSAKTITVTSLDEMGPNPLAASDMKTKYHAQQSQVKKYQTDLNSMDTNVADIAAKSADVTNTARTEVSNLVETIKGILKNVPDKPSVQQQLKAMDSDKAVGQAVKTVADARDQLAKSAGNITNPDPVTTDYSPVNSGSGRYPKLKQFAASQGKAVTDWHVQVDFMMSELQGSESGAYGQIKAAGWPGGPRFRYRPGSADSGCHAGFPGRGCRRHRVRGRGVRER
jgi:hypothetical protein